MSRAGRMFPKCRATVRGGALPGHLPESRLDFQLSLAQPLLLGESAFRVGLEAVRGRGDGSLDRWPFDQQGYRLGQVLVRNLRICSYDEEGEASAVRRRPEVSCGKYGIIAVGFKEIVVRGGESGLQGGEAEEGFG